MDGLSAIVQSKFEGWGKASEQSSSTASTKGWGGAAQNVRAICFYLTTNLA